MTQRTPQTIRPFATIAAGVMAISAMLTTVVTTQAAENSMAIDPTTMRQWSAPYRGWHYYPDHVIPSKPGIEGFEKSTRQVFLPFSNCRATRNGI